MKDTDFTDVDEWGDYEPTLNEKKEIINPDIFPLRRNTEFSLIEGFDKDEFEEYVIGELDEDDEDDYTPFMKSGEYQINGETVTSFTSADNDEYNIIVKGTKNYFIYIYQPNNEYKDGNKLTMTGWDYNIIVDMSNMTFKRKNVR